MTRVAIIASGAGSNAKALIKYFFEDEEIEVAIVASNKHDAGVLKISEEAGIEALYFSKQEMESGYLLKELKARKIDWVLLSGFLLKLPMQYLDSFSERVINIHPSLLPKYGGKGMYGMNVHKAVKESNEMESGMTIHYVTENYDEGDIIFQVSVDVSQCKSAEDIASKVLDLEHTYYPRIAEAVIKG